MLQGMATSIERVRVKLPAGFNENKHVAALLKKVTEVHGEGFELDSIDPDERVAVVSRQSTITQVTASAVKPDSFDVRLVRGTSPSHGDKMAAKLADQYADHGVVMTRFEPFLGRATLSKLDEDALRCRGAVAVALGVKEWDIQVARRTDGGFELELPKTYVSSKHYDKLMEVATTVVGSEGWYVKVDSAKLTAQIIPSTPPTFAPTLPFPGTKGIKKFSPKDPSWSRIPIGEILPEPGHEGGQVLSTDFVANPMMQVSGITGGGKGVLLTSLLAGMLLRGWEVALVDAVKAGVDFADFMPYLRPHGMAENLEEAVTVLAMAYEEGTRRKELIKKYRVQKWTQLPEDLGIRPLGVIVDEATSLLQEEKVPKLAKDHPLVLEVQHRNGLKNMALNFMGKIARELRFAGVSLVMSSQVASSTSGIPTELRGNLGAKTLLGAKPTDNNRRLALSAPDTVPKVPGYLLEDAAVSRGVGVYEFEGTPPGVFKGFFSPPPDIAKVVGDSGAPTTKSHSPTAAQIAKYTPDLEDDGATPPSAQLAPGERTPSGKPLDPKFGPPTGPDGEPLRGFGKANAARATLAAEVNPDGTAKDPASTTTKKAGPVTDPICPSCDRKIDVETGQCGC